MVAVLHLDTRVSRYSVARDLEGLFAADHIKVGEASSHAIKPLVEILSSGSENEQCATIGALITLLFENPSRALVVVDVETNAVDVLCRILSSNCSMGLKEDATELCCVLFGNSKIISKLAIARCVEPLGSGFSSCYRVQSNPPCCSPCS